MKYRDANIRVVLNGFIVKIGCSEVVAETPESLLKLITRYLKDPDKTEKEMFKKKMYYGNTVGSQDNIDIPLLGRSLHGGAYSQPLHGSITTAGAMTTGTAGTNIRGESC